MKPPEVLARDRLLATYESRPVLAKLRKTLLGAGGMLLASSLLLAGLVKLGPEDAGALQVQRE